MNLDEFDKNVGEDQEDVEITYESFPQSREIEKSETKIFIGKISQCLDKQHETETKNLKNEVKNLSDYVDSIFEYYDGVNEEIKLLKLENKVYENRFKALKSHFSDMSHLFENFPTKDELLKSNP